MHSKSLYVYSGNPLFSHLIVTATFSLILKSRHVLIDVDSFTGISPGHSNQRQSVRSNSILELTTGWKYSRVFVYNYIDVYISSTKGMG